MVTGCANRPCAVVIEPPAQLSVLRVVALVFSSAGSSPKKLFLRSNLSLKRSARSWFHAVGEPGGRAFCHLDEPDQRTHVTWTSEAGRPILVIAKMDGLQHRFLFQWWRRVRHDIV